MLSRRQYVGVLGTVAVTGLIGGGFSNWLLAGRPLGAEQTARSTEVVEARWFEVIDGDGKRRARLGVTEGGEPKLELHDGTGKTRVELGLTEEGMSGLRLRDRSGRRRVVLTLTEEGRPGLGLYDGRDGVRMALAVMEGGDPRVVLFASDGKVLWRAP